ncbi:MAG: hypothetical protein RIR49_718 [Actinomycetota bacterium]
MTTPTPHDERAAKLAALKAARQERSASDPTTAPPPAAAATRRPARAAKVATVGLSTTAVLGLMAAYGNSEGAAASTAPDPVGSSAITPLTAGTIRVAADAEAIVLVVDAQGTPIDLVHMPSVVDLQAFLQQATPIIRSAHAVPDTNPVVAPTAVPATNPPVPSAASTRPDVTAPSPPVVAAPQAVPGSDPATPGPDASIPVVPAPTSTAPTTSASADTPAVTVPPTPVAPVATAPASPAPVAQPAPVELAIPLPAPTGNTAGS